MSYKKQVAGKKLCSFWDEKCHERNGNWCFRFGGHVPICSISEHETTHLRCEKCCAEFPDGIIFEMRNAK